MTADTGRWAPLGLETVEPFIANLEKDQEIRGLPQTGLGLKS
jgi:hypothetical protein